MEQSPKIKEYLTTICQQIRWKKAHEVISEEIENHIIDQKNAFIANGIDEETATNKAMQEMGDPIIIGAQLDRAYRPKIQWSIIALISIIMLLGFAIRIFLSYDLAIPIKLNNVIVSSMIGLGCMVIAYYLDFTIIGKHPIKIYFSLVFLAIAAIFVKQPIDGKYLFLLFPIAFSGIIYRMRSKGYLGIILSVGFLVLPILISLNSKSLSSIFLYSVSCLIILTMSIIKNWFNVKKLYAMLLASISIISMASIKLLVVAINSPYYWMRLQNSINPSHDSMGAGYISNIVRNIIKGAKIVGQEKTSVNYKYSLPAIDTDYLLTYLIHRLGWISFAVIITALISLIIRSLILSLRQKSILGKSVATSAICTIIMEVLIYVISNLGFQLFAPLTLPFISYGGTGTIINMWILGIILSVFKSGEVVKDKLTLSKIRKGKLFEFVDGKIIIDLNLM